MLEQGVAGHFVLIKKVLQIYLQLVNLNQNMCVTDRFLVKFKTAGIVDGVIERNYQSV